ncbi:unnamed protein product, partial [Laminaria digitata]
MDGFQNHHEQQQLGAVLAVVDERNGEGCSGGGVGGGSPDQGRPMPDSARRNALREANRIHCKETRERKKKKEQLLREEVEILQLCKTIVEHGPDLFSLHRMEEHAPFR